MNSIKNKSVLVTGGCGFIGSHLVDRLVKDNPEKVVVVDNFFLGKESNLADAKEIFEGIKIIKGCAEDKLMMGDILRTENVDVVFNLAVIPLPTSLVKPAWTVEVNVNITNVLCELQWEGAFETLIHCSSSEVYGSAITVPMNEDHPLNATTPYAASKAACDHIVQSYYRTFGLDLSVIRPFNNYGPRQNENAYAGIIPTTIRRILEGKHPVIFGDGNQTRDYIYVTDTAEAIVDTYKNNEARGKVINVGSGKEIAIKEIVEIICKKMDWTDDIIYENMRKGDVRRHCADISLAKKIINFKPKLNQEEGLETTVNWYQKVLGGDR
jgi:UDP-glucose 4-epimerase